MNIDKLIQIWITSAEGHRFGSLMNIDKLIQPPAFSGRFYCFGSLMNIYKLILLQRVRVPPN